MRNACEFLGIAKSGGKRVLFERLQRAVRESAAKLALDAAKQERRAQRRDREHAPIAAEPTDEERKMHELTHLPFEAWCEACQATRSRDSERHEKREQVSPTISMDYMTTNTGTRPDETEVKHLVAVNNWTKTILAVPIKAKGDESLKVCVQALCGFTREFDSIILKGDQEPSLKQVIKRSSGSKSFAEAQD